MKMHAAPECKFWESLSLKGIKMIDIKFYKLNRVGNDRLKYAIIVASYAGRWVFVKNKNRNTWEMPAGHREKDEDIIDTASRELREETGAEDFEMIPVCIYSVTENNIESFGQLFFANIYSMGKLPNFEIGERRLFDHIPDKLTYPQVQPRLFDKVMIFYKNMYKIM